MALNRFDQRAKDYPWVESYVPLPLNLIAEMGARKQKKFDDDLEDIKATQGLIKIEADPHRRAVRNQLLQQYNDELTNLTDAYVKTGDPALASQVRDVKRRFANDPIRLGLESSNVAWKEAMKDAEAAKKEGVYSEYKDYDPYKFDKEQQVEGFKPFDYTGAYRKQDYRTTGQSLISDIAKDSKAWEGMQVDKSTGMPDIGVYGQYWKRGSSKAGVTKPKVLTIAETNAENLISDPKTGGWFVDEAVNKVIPGSGHVNYNNLSEELQDHVKKEATDYLFTLGAKQVGLETKSTEDLQFLPAGAQEKREADKLITFNEGEAVNLTPEEVNASRDNLRALTNQYKGTERELSIIEKKYGRSSQQYATKKAEMQSLGASLNNTKTALETIDNNMQTTTHKVDFDNYYKMYQESSAREGVEPMSKEKFINSAKNFDEYKEEQSANVKEGKLKKDIPEYYNYVHNLITQAKDDYETKQTSYLKETNQAYTAQPIHGEPTSTTGKMNKLLTERFRNSTTNYTTPTGLQVPSILAEKYEDRDPTKDEVVVTHRSIGGQPVQYLTVKDKDGKILGNEYITPKNGGLESMSTVALSILNSTTPGSGEWEKGKEMLINSKFLPAIQKGKMDSGGVKTILFDDGSKVKSRKVVDEQSGLTYYELLNPTNNQPLKDETGAPFQAGSEEELAEIIFNNK